MTDLAIISGSSNKKLAESISNVLGIELIKSKMITFGNSERQVEISESVRNKDVFVIQSSSDTTNDHIMELLLILDALKRSSCYRVTTVMPNYPYGRQDRKVKSRVPISAKLLANLIQTAGTDRFLTSELHAPQISGFFDIPTDNLYSAPVFLEHIRQNHADNNVCIVAPDAGSVKVAKMYAGRLNCDVAMIYKNRSEPGEIKEMKLIGDVDVKNCIIVDDMADSCGTICKATALIKDNGAKSVEAYCTHAILGGKALDNLNNSVLNRLYVTDTIDNPRTLDTSKITVLTMATLFAEAIAGIHKEESLSHLFDM